MSLVNTQELSVEKVLDWALRVGIVIIGFVLSQGINKLDNIAERIVDLQLRMTVVERSYASQSDILSLEARRRNEVDDAIQDIKTCLNKIQRNQQCD